jgi:hypothetical protein
MGLYTISGEKIYIGPVKEPTSVDFISSDFTGTSPDQWILIDGWITMGQLGDSAAVITTSLINRGRDVKQKGTNNAHSGGRRRRQHCSSAQRSSRGQFQRRHRLTLTGRASARPFPLVLNAL